MQIYKTRSSLRSLSTGDTICDEYIGIDYQSSVSAGLYHYTFRDIVNWALGNGLKAYASTGLCYDPKLHLKQELVPLDLYVRLCSMGIWTDFRIL